MTKLAEVTTREMASAASETEPVRLSDSLPIPDSHLKKYKPGEGLRVTYRHRLPDNSCLDVFLNFVTDQQRGCLEVGLGNYGSSDVVVVSAVITLAGKTFTDEQFTVTTGQKLCLADVSLDKWRAGLRDGVGMVCFELVIKKKVSTEGPPKKQSPAVKNTDIEGKSKFDCRTLLAR